MGTISTEVARLSVRLAAVGANYRTCQRLAGPAAVAGVVKADAYGLGLKPVVGVLAEQGCDTFFVARIEEGVSLRSLVPQARIYLLDGVTAMTAPAVISHRLVPVLNSLEEISVWSEAARSTGSHFDCAIHVDTGMNRLGLPAYELSILAAEANTRLAHLHPVLVMSHLACSDDTSSAMNATQLARFRDALAMLPPAPASLAASGGVLLGKEYAFDTVRVGIGLYGGNPHWPKQNPFAVVASLTARILQIHQVGEGETVGYGASHRVKGPTTLATVGLGYADGLIRAMGNRGEAAISGMRAPVVGRVSMDLANLDVTRVAAGKLKKGVEVEFFGDTISLEECADSAGTVNYEMLASLGPRIPRYYVEGAR